MLCLYKSVCLCWHQSIFRGRKKVAVIEVMTKTAKLHSWDFVCLNLNPKNSSSSFITFLPRFPSPYSY